MFSELLSSVSLPVMRKVSYLPPAQQSVDPAAALNTALDELRIPEAIFSGKTVALTCGSRDIANIARILRQLVFRLRQAGALPFIVPAMGSHGGATAQGQLAVLESLGVTESTVNAPIRSSMETDLIATTDRGIPVYMDRLAHSADFIIPVGRVKPHTEFHGDIESGVLKMIAVGLGKQKGASVCHSLGRAQLSENIIEIAQTALRVASVPFAIAIVENTDHTTHSITAIPASQILAQEKQLLLQAKRLLPRIPFTDLDVLVVYEMGKDISGTGMDSNVTGRSIYLPPSHPYAKILSVLRLTEKSHNNANGLGCADVTVKKLVDSLSPQETFPNAITSLDSRACRIPVYMPNDLQAMQLSILFSQVPADTVRMVLIKNTLDLSYMYISDALLSEDNLPAYVSPCNTQPLQFNAAGELDASLWS